MNNSTRSLARSDTAGALGFLVNRAEPQLFGNLGPASLDLMTKRPDPLGDLLGIDSILIRLVLGGNLLVQQLLADHAASISFLQAIESVHCQTVTIRLVPNGELQRRVNVS